MHNTAVPAANSSDECIMDFNVLRYNTKKEQQVSYIFSWYFSFGLSINVLSLVTRGKVSSLLHPQPGA